MKLEPLQPVAVEERGALRPLFKSAIWKNGPSPWEIGTFKGYVGVKISIIGSWSRDPQFEILHIKT